MVITDEMIHQALVKNGIAYVIVGIVCLIVGIVYGDDCKYEGSHLIETE